LKNREGEKEEDSDKHSSKEEVYLKVES